MNTYTYIHNSNPNNYFTLDYELTEPNGYNTGTTYEDYLKGYYVLISDEQLKFHQQYPKATVEQVIKMEVPKRTIEEAKREMKTLIELYDNSTNVNGFTINEVITAWFTVQERLNYKQSVEAAKLMNIESLSFFVGNSALTVSTAEAELMLAALQLYADQCYMVTKQHKINVDELETVEEVDSYNYKSGYPERLNFNLIA